MRERAIGKTVSVHRHAWLWEPLESDPGFILGSMFGTKVVYLDGRLALCFATKEEPWRGVMVCTGRERQAGLRVAYPSLVPHPVLPKWLYLAESSDDFERTAQSLVERARQRDPLIGVDANIRGRRAPRETGARRRRAGP
jgi:hypothetical protein